MDSIALQQDLYEKSVKQFDLLRSGGTLLFEETTPEYVENNGFKVDQAIYSPSRYRVLEAQSMI